MKSNLTTLILASTISTRIRLSIQLLGIHFDNVQRIGSRSLFRLSPLRMNATNNPFCHLLNTIITRKYGFSEGQCDRSVHIDQRVCPFRLKVWGMKNTCHIWLKYLFDQMSSQRSDQNEQIPSKWPWLSQINYIEWIGFNQIDHPDLTFS
jgi:hypothetical protein